jgi:hypothetical protein
MRKASPLAGTEILDEAFRLVSKDRQGAYGHPLDDYTKVTEIFKSLTGKELSVYEALLFMVSVKLARLRTNLEYSKVHHDSLVDALGYLTCIKMVEEANNVVSR